MLKNFSNIDLKGTQIKTARVDNIFDENNLIYIGQIGLDTNVDFLKYKDNTTVQIIASQQWVTSQLTSSGVSTFSTGSTGLNTNANIGNVTLSGVLNVSSGGTGLTSLNGILKGNGNASVQPATPGVDYLEPNGDGSNLLNVVTLINSIAYLTGSSNIKTIQSNSLFDSLLIGNMTSPSTAISEISLIGTSASMGNGGNAFVKGGNSIINGSGGKVGLYGGQGIGFAGGNIELFPGNGTSSGKIYLTNSSTIGYVWTATNAFGAGSWQMSAGGGGGVISLTGTVNQINVSAPTGNVTLSLPQDIASTSLPTFNNIILTNLGIGGGIVKATNFTGALSIAIPGTDYQNPIGTFNGLVKGNGNANVLIDAIPGTDYQNPIGTFNGIVKGNGNANVLIDAVAGTDFAPATIGSSLLYGNGAGGFSNAIVSSGLTFSSGDLGFRSQISNQVYAAPNGTSGIPGFRNLIPFDINNSNPITNVTGEYIDIDFNLNRSIDFTGIPPSVTNRSFYIRAATLTRSNTPGYFIPKASTFVVSGPPSTTGNVTIQSPYALEIESGKSLFNGDINTNNGIIASSVGFMFRTSSYTYARQTIDTRGNFVFQNDFSQASNSVFINFIQNDINGLSAKGIIYKGGLLSLSSGLENTDVDFQLNRNVNFYAGLPIQRAFIVRRPSYGSVFGSVAISTAATVSITGAPGLGSGGGSLSMTDSIALLIESGSTFSTTNSYGIYSNAMTGAINNYSARFSGGPVWFNDVNLTTGTTTGTKIGTSVLQKIGFYNNTPIIQPNTSVTASALIANTGVTINDATTFDGYTLKQIVKALRNLGLLA